MLSNCPVFRANSAFLKNRLGCTPYFISEVIGASGSRYRIAIVDQDTWRLEQEAPNGSIVGHATNIKEIVVSVRHLIPEQVIGMLLKIEAGGNEWSQLTDITLANPEAIASGFESLFRQVLHESTGTP